VNHAKIPLRIREIFNLESALNLSLVFLRRKTSLVTEEDILHTAVQNTKLIVFMYDLY